MNPATSIPLSADDVRRMAATGAKLVETIRRIESFLLILSAHVTRLQGPMTELARELDAFAKTLPMPPPEFRFTAPVVERIELPPIEDYGDRRRQL